MKSSTANRYFPSSQVGISRFIDRHWTVGLGLSFDYERWNFSDIDKLAGVDLWDEISRPSISLPVFHSTGDHWRFGIIPSIDFTGASGADTSESVSYGVVLSAAYAFGQAPHPVLGRDDDRSGTSRPRLPEEVCRE